MANEFKREAINNYSASISGSFAAQLRAKRLENELSLKALSTMSGISMRWLIYIEINQRLPSLYTITALSVALDFYEWEFFQLKRL